MDVVQGIGSITLVMHDGTKLIVKDVSYFPELKRNVISLGSLDHLGYTFKAQES